VSAPARPESAGHAALTELTSVIGHVTEQLAGFRRRALAAESRVRELELVTAAAAAEAAQAAADAVSAKAAARVGSATARTGADGVATEAVLAENALLRERLAEAAVRTRSIAERVRFLRQQLSNGGEK